MKLKCVSLSLLVCAAALFPAVTIAHADTITGKVWENQNSFRPGVALAAPSGSAAATFTVSALDFYSDASNYTIGGFLGSNLTSSLSSSVSHADLDNTIFEFSGTTILKHGASYAVTHDDGMYLFIGTTYAGKIVANPTNSALSLANFINLADHTGEVINEGLPTSAETSSFVWAGASGSYSFDVLYTEVNGQPAVLQSTTLPTSVTPEPSTFVLMGSGLIGAAGALRRRLRA